MVTATESGLETWRDDGVEWIALNRPERLNAFTWALRDDLINATWQAGLDPTCRAVVLTGRGRGFCSGVDVGAVLEAEVDEPAVSRRQQLERTQHLVTLLHRCPKPVIAAVNGMAAGGGWSLALAADLVVASTAAEFYMVFGRIGLVPDLGALWFLPRRVGPARARDIVVHSRRLTAEGALRIGAVDELCEPDDLLAAAQRMAVRAADAGEAGASDPKRRARLAGPPDGRGRPKRREG